MPFKLYILEDVKKERVHSDTTVAHCEFLQKVDLNCCVNADFEILNT